MKTALVIMAAGIGSRFGQGIKQLTPVGPSGELIIDYSVYDALAAGFDKIVFVIRKDIEQDFREVIGDRLARTLNCEIAYAYQDLQAIPAGRLVPEGRTKPWGTGQAILACKGIVKEPFAIINADDYYGKEAFVKLHDYLAAHGAGQHDYCMAGFILENTLSENGGVTRGICQVDGQGRLSSVKETRGILREGDGAVTNGGERVDLRAHVSMNMWGVTPEFLEILEKEFDLFFDSLGDDPLKSEFLLPIIMDKLIGQKLVTVTLLESQDKWFGVTYAQDRPAVAEAFRRLVADGVYPSPLE